MEDGGALNLFYHIKIAPANLLRLLATDFNYIFVFELYHPLIFIPLIS